MVGPTLLSSSAATNGQHPLSKIHQPNELTIEQADAIIQQLLDALNQLHQVVNEFKSPNLANNSAQVRTLLENTLNSITQAQNGILSVVTELGGRQNTLSLLQETNSQVSLTNQKIDNDLN